MEIFYQFAVLIAQPTLSAKNVSSTVKAVKLLEQHFRDQSQLLKRALRSSEERAWKVLELALSGGTWWDRAQSLFRSGDEKALAQSIQHFLNTVPQQYAARFDHSFRKICCEELRKAKQQKFLPGDDSSANSFEKYLSPFCHFTQPTQWLAHEWEALSGIGESLAQSGYSHLAQIVSLRPSEETPPLLLLAARYFFRREVEKDAHLSRSLTFQSLEHLSQEQAAGFQSLHQAFENQAEKMDNLLDSLDGMWIELEKIQGGIDSLLVGQQAQFNSQKQQNEWLEKIYNILQQQTLQQHPSAPSASSFTPLQAPTAPPKREEKPAPPPSSPPLTSYAPAPPTIPIYPPSHSLPATLPSESAGRHRPEKRLNPLFSTHPSQENAASSPPSKDASSPAIPSLFRSPHAASSTPTESPKTPRSSEENQKEDPARFTTARPSSLFLTPTKKP